MYQVTNIMYQPCTAHITINRNRVKIYGDVIYLKNGQKFEIELFNPTISEVLAKISLNGKLISESGIILRPGERIYLERYIDSNNKFIFETYEVEKTKEALDAIQNNGLVKVSFYSAFYSYIYNPPLYYPPEITNYPFYTFCSNGTTENIDNNGGLRTITIKSLKTSKSIETGIIRKGDYSNQEFNQIFGDFNFLPLNSVTYKILPESQKPIEYSSLRNYCSECGIRIKKTTWKFCPNCGKNLR